MPSSSRRARLAAPAALLLAALALAPLEAPARGDAPARQWGRVSYPDGREGVLVPDTLPFGAGEVMEFDLRDGEGGSVLQPDAVATIMDAPGIAVGPDGALYVGDDVGGRIWKITYAGM